MSADVSVIQDEVDPRGSLLSKSERFIFGLRLLAALAATALLLISVGIQFFFPHLGDISQLVAGLAAALVAIPALQAAWYSLKYPDLHGITDQLIALALIAAWASGDMITAALLPLVMTVGHILEERSLLGSQEAIRALSRLTQVKARRITGDGKVEQVPANVLDVGDLLEVRPGDSIAADGTVESGMSNVDTASITGESVPVELREGDEVLSGSINLDGLITVRVLRVGEQATLGRVVALLQDAEAAKPPITRLLEKYAEAYMALVLLLAAGAWLVTGSTSAMLAVLVASCPCALVLAAPATSIAAIAVASRHGILVKGAAFLESLATVNSVVFDKTGTVTAGQLSIAEVRPEQGIEERQLRLLASALGATSNHPVSRAMVQLNDEAASLELSNVREEKGLGVVCQFEGQTTALGRSELFEELGVKTSPVPSYDGPIVGVSHGKRFLGWIFLADRIRPEAVEAVQDLQQLGLGRQLLVTGDRQPVADRIAGLLGIADVRAQALPAKKMEYVLAEVKSGYRPLVVGDGINDALALKAGAVGIAMGAQGTDVALASADLVLMSSDLRRLGTSIRLSRRCRRTIYTNVAIGLGWTVVIVAIAITGTMGTAGPVIAALLHNFSTLLVMGNAGRLLKFQEVHAPA
jgi:Cd2+/Zn2+-exporting ATPase